MMHPEARRALLLREARERSPAPTRWRPNDGWCVILFGDDGGRRYRFASTYDAAVALRAEALADGRYWQGVIEMRTIRQVSKPAQARADDMADKRLGRGKLSP